MPRQSVPNISSNAGLPKRRKNLQQYFNQDPLRPISSNIKKNSRQRLNLNMHRERRSKSKPRTSRKPDYKKKKSSNKVNHMQRSGYKQKNHIQQKGTPFNKFSKGNQKQNIILEYDSPQKPHEQFELLFGNRLNKKKKQSNQAVQLIIDKVDELLKQNKIRQAINVLNQTMIHHSNHSQLNYLLGACYLVISEVQIAKQIFQKMLANHPRKNIYLLLSVCYKKMDENQKAKLMLDMCIEKYPKYYEAYIYRAKIFLKANQYRKGLIDFEKALNLKPQKIIAYTGKGDCLRLSSKFNQARAVYIQGLSIQRDNKDLLIRKAICQLQLGKFDFALTSISQLLTIDPQNSQALYFKGLIFRKLGDQNEAIISFQQALKFNTNKRAVTRSIYQLAKIQIQQKNYYEAVHTLQRAQHLETQQKVLTKLKIFTDGITSLMKKNYTQGLISLNRLQQENLNRFLKPLFYSARAYGYMNQMKFYEAKADFDIIQRDFNLDTPSLYNKFICEGILACNDKKYQQALSVFSKAGKVVSTKLEPSFYKAVCLVSFAMKLIPKTMIQKRKQYLTSAMKVVSKIQAISDNNPSLHLVRGVIYFALGMHQQAHTDFKNCLNESIKPNAKAFYLNGLLYGELGQYTQAVKQFQTAIHYAQPLQAPEIYLNKAKCMLLLGDVNAAFMDLQNYMSGKASSPDIHIWAGHLLFHIGAWDDAAKAYSNINNLNKNFQVLLYKARCHLISKDVAVTITTFKTMVGIKSDAKAQFDLQLLEMLQNCAEEQAIDYSALSKRLVVLKKLIDEENINNRKEFEEQKMDKGQKQKEKEKENQDLNLNLNEKDKEKQKAFQISYLFSESDYYFFTGVFQLHAGNYQKAIQNLFQSKKIIEYQFKHQDKQSNSFLKSYYQLTFVNMTFNSFQLSYNIAMAYICNKQYDKAIAQLKDLQSKLKKNKKHSKEVQLLEKLRKLIDILGKELSSSQKQSKKKSSFQIEPFPVQARLCSIFPQIIVQLKQQILKTRIYFCLPYVKSPQIKPGFDDKILSSMDMKWIQIKPQAPWIRRSSDGVIFTSVVAQNDIELSQSEKQQKNDQQQQEHNQQQSYQHNQNEHNQQFEQISHPSYQENNSYHNKRGVPNYKYYDQDQDQQQYSNVQEFDPKKLKMQLMLDPQIQNKLNKRFG